VVWRGTPAAEKLTAEYDRSLFVLSGSLRFAPHPPCTASGAVGSCLEEDGSSRVRIYAGAGDDRIRVRTPRRDRIDCGPGNDVARIGRKDRAIGCETVYRHPAP
jgi:hypothetical protein